MNDDQLFAALRDVTQAADRAVREGPVGDPLVALARNYHLRGVLGAGGQGTVYGARRRRDGAEVAIKVFRAVHGPADVRLRDRLTRIVELVGELDHDAIVPTLDHGSVAGHVYTVEPLVRGERLDTWSRALAPSESTRRRLAVAEALVRAVAHAHGRGVIHRDLKPSNVLVDADDRPRLLDFGIARSVGPERPVTATAEFVGTLAYSAPERLRDPAPAPDVRQDVYSLGAVLYELFAGGPPFASGSGLTALLADVQAGAPPLRDVGPGIAAVVAIAMHPEVERRYRTALELADDLGRLRRCEPARARFDGLMYRGWRLARRRPATFVGTLLALVSVGLVALLWQRDRDATVAGEALQEVARAAAGDDASMPARLAAAVLHLQDADVLPIVRADLFEKLGRLWLDLGCGERGEPHLRHARELVRRGAHPDPDRLLGLDVAIGRCLAERRRDEGLPLLEGALRTAEQRHGATAGATALVRLRLAEALATVYYRPDHARAARELERARRDLVASFGEGHPHVAWADVVRRRAGYLRGDERRPDSPSARARDRDIALLTQQVEILRAADVPPRQFAVAAQLLASRRAAVDPTDELAIALRREAGARLQSAGAWHLADLVRAEAMIRYGQGDLAGAERHVRRALALELERHAGRDGVTGDLVELVATLHGAATSGSTGARRHPVVEGHVALLEALDRHDWRRAADMQDDARVLAENGDVAAARALLEHALTVTCQEFGRNCPVRLGSLRLLADAERRAGELERARDRLVELWQAAATMPRRLDRYRDDAIELAAIHDALGETHAAAAVRAELRRLESSGPEPRSIEEVR